MSVSTQGYTDKRIRLERLITGLQREEYNTIQACRGEKKSPIPPGPHLYLRSTFDMKNIALFAINPNQTTSKMLRSFFMSVFGDTKLTFHPRSLH